MILKNSWQFTVDSNLKVTAAFTTVFISMDGVYFALSQEGGAIISMDGVYFALSQEGGAIISMDGRAENCSLRFPHFHHPWWSYFAMSQEGGAIISMDGVYAKNRLRDMDVT